MDLKTIILVLFLATLTTAAIIHYPEVKEEVTDENVRSLRTPEKLQKFSNPAFNPTPFTFQTALQQDYLKQRYAEQQQVDVEEIAKLRRKPIQKIYQKTKLEYDRSSEPYDWQPFLSTKRRTERKSEEYVPLVVKSSKTKKDVKGHLNKNDQVVDRKDDQTSSSISDHIIYVDPRILKQLLELKNKKKQIQSRSISIEPAIEVNSNSLSDLLNKNPHINLDGIKNLIQDPRQRHKIFPVIGGPQPFHQKDHTPITEKIIDVPNPRSKPNIEVNHDQLQHQEEQEPLGSSLSSIIPQQGQVITKEDFEKIQKQLEQSSKFQVEDALLRAQQEAQAHVEAQHKAIEQAQRAILENVQKQLQEASPEALRLVQEQIPQFNPSEKQTDAPQALALVQQPPPELIRHITAPYRQQFFPTPLPEEAVSPVHEVTIPTSNIQVHSYKTKTLSDYLQQEKEATPTPQKLVTEHPQPQNIRIIKVSPGATQVPKHYFLQPHNIKQVMVSPKPKTQHSNYVFNTVSPQEQETVSTVQNVIGEQPHLRNIKIVKVTPGTTQVPKHVYLQPQVKHVSQKPVVQQSSSNSIEHYAPNHLHQAVAQLQAEKVLLAQVQSHNNAIMNGKKGSSRFAGQKALQDSSHESKDQDKEAHGSANAYQQVALAPRERQKLKSQHLEEDGSDENVDLQYAAKYAFGYRIRDNKEGNDYGHQEKRSGRSAEGSYEVLLPDGRRQKVQYYADDTGYHAKVTYENVAAHN